MGVLHIVYIRAPYQKYDLQFFFSILHVVISLSPDIGRHVEQSDNSPPMAIDAETTKSNPMTILAGKLISMFYNCF